MLLAGMLADVLLFAAFAGIYFLKKDSADGQSLMWKITLQTAKKHPLGAVLGNFSGAYGTGTACTYAEKSFHYFYTLFGRLNYSVKHTLSIDSPA